ncbi:MAG: DUF3410 domain-containing protein [Bacteroidales bacterium]|nr:DUF3410 domain-containing protein [Bacteroidales bacterium]MCL2738046.1 DUF3410 domain-containing protein [Bacteroidales bacterium]
MARKKIVVDADIPYIQGVLEPYAEVCYVQGGSIDRRCLDGVHGLVVRTRTKCGPALLDGTDIAFIGTATVGVDHVDMDYCRRMGIQVASAAGCNAPAVVQYVLTAVFSLVAKQRKNLDSMTLGIIGAGNVGGRLAQAAQALGMKVLINDPPRALREGNTGFVSLERLLNQSDIVSLHVPLQSDTLHLADSLFFERLGRTPIFINTSRGQVVDEAALLRFSPKMNGIVLDVWEREPEISHTTLDAATIATPHIAGYSIEGKRKASMMMIRELAGFFGWKELKNFSLPNRPTQRIVFPDKQKVREEAFSLMFNKIFPIFDEDFNLRLAPERFESLRTHYTYRRENSGYTVKGADAELKTLLQALGFIRME